MYSLPDATTTQTDLVDNRYTFDAVGNPTFIRDVSVSSWPEHAAPVQEKELRYDDFYRLIYAKNTYATPTGSAAWQSPGSTWGWRSVSPATDYEVAGVSIYHEGYDSGPPLPYQSPLTTPGASGSGFKQTFCSQSAGLNEYITGIWITYANDNSWNKGRRVDDTVVSFIIANSNL
jgi:hypothetical protein